MTAAAMSLLAAGCSKEGRPSAGWESDPDAVRVEASVGTATKTSPLGTGDEQTKFSKGDRIAVAALDNGTVKKAVKYQLEGLSWAPVADESGATDYLVWNTPVTFRAWYPARKSTDGSEFFLSSTQVNSAFLAGADIMSSEDYTYSTLKDIPGDRTFKPVLKRRMALVTVIIDKVGDEYADLKDVRVRVHTINSAHAAVKLQDDGTFGSEGGMTVVNPYSHEVEGKNAYSAVVVPGEASEDVFLNVIVDGYIDEAKTDLKVIPEEVTGIPAAEAGKHYTYKLIVGKETVKIGGVTVEDWATGGKLDGKFDAESDVYSEWDGKKVSSGYTFYGSGTSGDPYLIQSAADLAGLAANVNAGTDSYREKYFRLETNIDLMGHEWTPIGKNSCRFWGNFDCNNKIITNMSITAEPSESNSGVGLFGCCWGATISKVVMKNAKIRCGENGFPAGLICGILYNGTVASCRVEGTISTTAGECGGIIGKVEGSSSISVSDCEAEIKCENESYYAGGIVGSAQMNWVSLTIERCTVKGEINGGNGLFGGIAGSLDGRNVLLKDCTSYVKLGKAAKGTHPKAGGLVGGLSYGKAEDCTVLGIISFSNESCGVGGMFSEAREVTLSNLSFRGDIDVTILPQHSVLLTSIGAFIGYLNGANGTTTATGCTYKKSGTGDYQVIGKCDDESFDTTALDIKGI